MLVNFKLLRYSLFIISFALLPACQHLPEQKITPITPQQQMRMQLNHWLLLGKIGIQLKGRAVHAEFIWTQQKS